MNQGCTWPEQDAVDSWLEKHGIKVDFKQAMELKEAVTKYRIEMQKERDALKKSQQVRGNAQEPIEFDVRCEHCHGDGLEPADNNYTCAKCHGTGFVPRLLYADAQAVRNEALEEFRKVLISIVPEQMKEKHLFDFKFADENERGEHRAEVAGWNNCRKAVMDAADTAFRALQSAPALGTGLPTSCGCCGCNRGPSWLNTNTSRT